MSSYQLVLYPLPKTWPCNFNLHFKVVAGKKKKHQISYDEEIEIKSVFETKGGHILNDDRFFVYIYVEGHKVEFECDSRQSIMSIQQFHELFPNYPIKKTNVVFRSCTGHTFTPVGVATVQVSYNGNSSSENLYLINFYKKAVLGRTWIRHLTVQLNDINAISFQNFSKESAVAEIVHDYKITVKRYTL